MAQPIGVILQDLADLDFFFYVLPFLLIFALVFAILQKINLMGGNASDNRVIYAVIAFAVALMSLQFDQVPIFFQIIFPKVGIALSILLTAIILVGLFIPFDKFAGPVYIFLTIGGLLAAWILLSSIEDYSWWTGSFWANNLPVIISLIATIVVIFFIVGGAGPKPKNRGFFLPIDKAFSTGE